MSKIKSCSIINLPTTSEEKEILEKKIAKALALALYRSLDEKQFNTFLVDLENDKKEEFRECFSFKILRIIKQIV